MLNMEHPTSKPIGNGWRGPRILYIEMQDFPMWDFDSQHINSILLRQYACVCRYYIITFKYMKLEREKKIPLNEEMQNSYSYRIS